MRKAVTVITVLVIGLGAYLGWDWYDKTHKQQLEPSITLYYWTDSKGGKHISDSPPPRKGQKRLHGQRLQTHPQTNSGDG